MITAVKIFFVDNVGNLIPSIVIQHQSAQYGLFGFNGMRCDVQRLASSIWDIR
jgi:hypothetical protein